MKTLRSVGLPMLTLLLTLVVLLMTSNKETTTIKAVAGEQESIEIAQAKQAQEAESAAGIKGPFRSIYVSGGGFSHPISANIETNKWGLLVKNSADFPSFVITQPVDWDITTPFTVTLHFALPTSTMASVVNWRLWTGGADENLDAGSADSGWDSLEYGPYEDGVPLNVFDATGYTYLMKSQSWTTKWSETYHTWYFGDSVTVANRFIDNPIWHFSFLRGAWNGNGETYTGDIVIVGAEIKYTSTSYYYSRQFLPMGMK